MIAQSELFAGVSDKQLCAVEATAQQDFRPAGTRIISAGSSDRTVYILVEGSVSIRIGSHDQIVIVSYSEPGVLFGEITLVDTGPRTATVVAETDVKLLSFGVAGLEQLFENDPVFEARVMRNLARCLALHLRQANAGRAESAQ